MPTATACALLLSLASGLDAQIPLAPGATVRLTTEGGAGPLATGTLMRVGSENLTLVTDGGREVTVAADDVVQAEVLTTRRNTLRGALIGGGVGLIAGLVTVASTDDDCGSDFTGFCDTITDTVDDAILVWFPILGAAGGALIGTLVKSDNWVPGVMPGRGVGAIGLGWSLPLGRF